ncbi:MAG: ATP-dependent DNA helicase [Burkholderiaceae bacterium]
MVELVARDKACEHPDKACHGDSCPLARGFYDRLPAARAEALSQDRALDQPALRTLALAHDICPYYLGQELTRWADVVVADYNHWFDTSAMLFAMTLAQEWKVALLIDEAHNLLERARRMYSAELERSVLSKVRRGAPVALTRAINRLARRWGELSPSVDNSQQLLSNVPLRFAAALQEAAAASTQHLAEHPTSVDQPLLDLHFELLRFARLLDSFGDHSIFEVTRQSGTRRESMLAIRNIIPAPHLLRRFATAETAVLFSATLTPFTFHRDTLGLPADSAWLDVESPFDPRQLSIRIARHLSTRQRDRATSLAPLADLMAGQFDADPGNYLAFFSSFEYLEQAAACMAERHPGVPIWQQSRGMGIAARDAFLGRFREDSRGIGFAVLGGTFGEGIDLPGRRLIGAFVATLGLPPPDALNEHLRQRMQAAFGNGYDYTYLFPGIQKVVQAVGRVIRNPTDRGVVHLVDDRFGRHDVRRLFPRWWQIDPGPLGAGSANRPGCVAVPRE